jgi:hypothetical protein
MNKKMIDETPKEQLHIDGVMLCTFRFFDSELPKNTRLIVKAKSDVKALEYAEKELGDMAYDLSMEIIAYRA